MTRRDSIDNPEVTDHTYGQLNIRWDAASYYRLRCLEIAVKSWHPDDHIDPILLMGVAQTLMVYVQHGDIPQAADQPNLHVMTDEELNKYVEERGGNVRYDQQANLAERAGVGAGSTGHREGGVDHASAERPDHDRAGEPLRHGHNDGG